MENWMVPMILSLLRSEGGEACLGTPHGDFLVSVSECVLSQRITVYYGEQKGAKWWIMVYTIIYYGIWHNYFTKLFSSYGGFLTNSMYHHRETIKLNWHAYDDTKKRAHDWQIVRAKENLKLSFGGPSQRQTSGTNQRIKALHQGHH